MWIIIIHLHPAPLSAPSVSLKSKWWFREEFGGRDENAVWSPRIMALSLFIYLFCAFVTRWPLSWQSCYCVIFTAAVLYICIRAPGAALRIPVCLQRYKYNHLYWHLPQSWAYSACFCWLTFDIISFCSLVGDVWESIEVDLWKTPGASSLEGPVWWSSTMKSLSSLKAGPHIRGYLFF